jgi:hypothetical protein
MNATTDADIRALLQRNNIKLKDSKSGNHYTTSPRCSSNRKRINQRKPCLSVKIDDRGTCWTCHHCGWSGPEKGGGEKFDIERVYSYESEPGAELFQVCRVRPKDFRARRRDETKAGGWDWSMGDVERVPYCLPELRSAIMGGETIYIVEGEKDVESLWAIGLAATCNPFGAGKWGDDQTKYMRNADVVIIPGNDDVGRTHAADVRGKLTGVAKSVRVVWLPPGAKDVSDWLAAGHTRAELDDLVAATVDWTSAPETWPDPDWSILDDRRGHLPDFPVDVVSPACRDWVERAAHGAGVTPAHVAVPLIGIASSLIGTARRVQASRSFTQPMTCWVSTVGFSGTGETPGIDATKRALALVERNRRERVAERQRAHETKRESAKAVRDAWSKQLKEIAGEGVVDLQRYRSQSKAEPPMPREAEDPGPFVAPRLHVSNSTIERIAQLLEVQPHGALLLSDELSGLFLNMSRYSGGQDDEFWLEAWNGGPYTVERLSRPSISLDYLLVGVVGGMQPDKLARSFGGDSDGMSARFLYSWPEEPIYQPLADDVSDVEPEIVNALTRLVGLAPGVGEEEEFAPRNIKLSATAVEAFERLRLQVYNGKHALDGLEREWWAKVPAHVLRLAGTLSLLDWAFAGGNEPAEIDERHVNGAVRLTVGYFWPHARACLRQIGLSDRYRNVRRVLRWMANNQATEVLREDVREGCLSRALDAEGTENLLHVLEKSGWVRKVSVTPGPKGGRPASRWSVNPKLFQAPETPETPETY